MSDDKKILDALNNMPEFQMDSNTKNRMLKNIKEKGYIIERSQKKSRIMGRVAAGIAACALAAACIFTIFTPTGQEFIGNLWNRNTPGEKQNLPQQDKNTQTPVPDTDNIKNTPQRNYGPDLTFVHMVDESTGWAAANDMIVRTVDGGKQWKDVTPQGITGPIKPYFLDRDHAWASPSQTPDSTTFIYSTSDGGSTWKKAALPVNGYASLQFNNDKEGWAIVSMGVAMHHEDVAVLRTIDGGTTWEVAARTDVQGGDEPGKLPFAGDKSGMYFADSKNGWITGDIPMDNYAYLYSTADGGRSWYEKKLPLPVNVSQAYLSTQQPIFFTQKDGILPVRISADTLQYVFYTTRDGGNTWIPGNLIKTSPDQTFIYCFTDKDHGFGTDGINVYITTDGGLSWGTLTPNIKLNRTSFMDFISSKTGFALVDGTLFKTSDGGKTWSMLGNTPQRAPGILESRLGSPLPYIPSIPEDKSRKPEDSAKELLSMYFDHYSGKDIPEQDRIKSYTINQIKLISSSGSAFTFSADYNLEGMSGSTSWAAANYAYAGDSLIKNGMFYITVVIKDTTLSMNSISTENLAP